MNFPTGKDCKQSVLNGDVDVAYWVVETQGSRPWLVGCFCKTPEDAEDVASVFDAVLSTPRVTKENNLWKVLYYDSAHMYSVLYVKELLEELFTEDPKA